MVCYVKSYLFCEIFVVVVVEGKKSSITMSSHSYWKTHKKVTDKQFRPRSDAT